MEALTIFGGAAAAVALSAQLLKLCRKLNKMAKSARYAHRDIKRISEEMHVFMGIYDTFVHVCLSKKPPDTSRARPLASLDSWIKSALRGLKKLLKGIKVLRQDKSTDHSIFEKLTAHLKWYSRKSSVRYFLSALRVARECINGYTNMRCIQVLEEELECIKKNVTRGNQQVVENAIGRTVTQHVELLRKRLRNCCRRQVEIDSCLQTAREEIVAHQEDSQGYEFVTDTDALLDFSDSVEDYIEEVRSTKLSGGEAGRFNRTQFGHRGANPRQPSTSTVDLLNAFIQDRDTEDRISSTLPVVTTEESPDLSHSLGTISTVHTDSSLIIMPRETSASVSLISSEPSSPSSSTFRNAAKSSLNSRNREERYAYRHTRPREYINDPDGDILSPPKVKNQDSAESPSRNVQIRENQDSTESPSQSVQIGENQKVLQKEPDTAAGVRDPEEKGLEDGTRNSPNIYILEDDSEGDTDAEPGSDDDANDANDDRPSPFRAVAGVQGHFPPGWNKRHLRAESPQDFW